MFTRACHPILNHMNLVHVLPSYLRKDKTKDPEKSVLEMVYFHQISPLKIWVCFTSPPYITCPIHLILLDLITWIMCSQVQIIKISSLCYLLWPPVTSSLSGTNMLNFYTFLIYNNMAMRHITFMQTSIIYTCCYEYLTTAACNLHLSHSFTYE